MCGRGRSTRRKPCAPAAPSSSPTSGTPTDSGRTPSPAAGEPHSRHSHRKSWNRETWSFSLKPTAWCRGQLFGGAIGAISPHACTNTYWSWRFPRSFRHRGHAGGHSVHTRSRIGRLPHLAAANARSAPKHQWPNPTVHLAGDDHLVVMLCQADRRPGIPVHDPIRRPLRARRYLPLCHRRTKFIASSIR